MAELLFSVEQMEKMGCNVIKNTLANLVGDYKETLEMIEEKTKEKYEIDKKIEDLEESMRSAYSAGLTTIGIGVSMSIPIEEIKKLKYKKREIIEKINKLRNSKIMEEKNIINIVVAFSNKCDLKKL